MIETTKGTAVKWLRKVEPLARFDEKVVKEASGCWFWQGWLDVNGYARFKIGSQSVLVHRWAYEYYRGAISKGFVIDHLCKNRSCVNPDHLEAITIKENNIRAKTHCRAGHPLTPENVYFTRDGTRICRLCQEERRAGYRQHSHQLRLGEKSITRTIILTVPVSADDGSLMQVLEQLKEQGIILGYR
ncbi:MAG TPA: HNH endonuclease signature motif containing protein [Ktedonobacterales bacterium]|nr:HNH endonuclease signature motif containing protein [Ktedonobacterales bacterium]